ncbi:MAG: OmpA family protein [Spirochaetota bacterium]
MKSKGKQKIDLSGILTAKNIVIASVVFAALIVGAVSFQVITQKMMFQTPMLVEAKPVITFVSGNAFVRKRPSSAWELAMIGRELKKGYEVKTESDSRMDIRFHAGTAATITENSIVKIDDLTVKRLSLELSRGAFFAKFEKLFNSHDLQVITPAAIAAVRGTELGFEVNEEQPKKEEKKEKNTAGTNEMTNAAERSYATTVYALSGITEVHNPRFQEKKMLLSYQNRITVSEDAAPEDAEKMSDDEVDRVRSKMNAIHFNEVLFISDKINFRKGSAEIQSVSFPELDKIGTIIKAKGAKIRIEGHTDSQGDAVFNQSLSIRRAEAIKAYLVEKGINKDRLETVGYGTSMPISDNRTEQGRSMNRRVEFIVVK